MKKKNTIRHIPVLQYTSVIEHDNGDTRFCTTVDMFAKDMHRLLTAGFTSVSLFDAYLFAQGLLTLPEKSFCLIFLGGYENNYNLAFPILKQLNIYASIFVATDLIGVIECPKIEKYSPHFGWEQAQEMIDSGLVNIYPFWHPFDNGKSLKDEAPKKIALLNNHLSYNNSSFAFAYTECDMTILSTLNEIGVKINITDCFHINLDNLERGALPSIYINHTSDIFDKIEQYYVLCQDAIDKDEAHLNETAVYIEPSYDILSTSIQLPIDRYPIVRNYLRHAFPLSILQADRRDKAERIVLRDYIEIIYKPWNNWFDYHNHLYEYWDSIDFRKITKDILDANRINIIDYIINGLTAGYYSDIWLDTYYIPEKSGYGQRHMSHGILIYGYDSKIQSFNVLSYTHTGRYQEFVVPVKAVSLACTNKYFMYLNLIRSTNGEVTEYDIHAIRDKLNDYINSVCYDDNNRYSKKSVQQYYNREACIEFAANTKIQAENKGYIHTTALYSYSEHKHLMMWRLQYIDEYEDLHIPNLKEKVTLYIHKSEQLVNLGLKFNMTKSEKTLASIMRIINELNCAEKTLICLVITSIDKKYDSVKPPKS